MGAEDNGLTLEGLAHKLEALQRENSERLETLERENSERLETLERENTELRNKVATLEGSGTRRDELAEKRGSGTDRPGQAASLAFDGQVSRRSLLSKAGAAAVAAVAAGTLMYPRQARADHLAPGIEVDYVVTHLETPDSTAVFGNAPNGEGVVGFGETNGVRGKATNGVGVRGEGRYGVFGEGQEGVFGRGGDVGVKGNGVIGVWGRSATPGEAAVYAQHASIGPGVVADGWGANHAGVLGRNGDGTGVWGKSSKTGYGAVYGEHDGTAGYGVVGVGIGESGAGVVGRNSGGYGGQFEGGKAQLKLKPGGSAGKPTTGTHTKGEIYMDSRGALFVCTAGDGTTVGTWKKVNMDLV